MNDSSIKVSIKASRRRLKGSAPLLLCHWSDTSRRLCELWDNGHYA